MENLSLAIVPERIGPMSYLPDPHKYLEHYRLSEIILYINSQVNEQPNNGRQSNQIALFFEAVPRLLLIYQGSAGWIGYTTFQRHSYTQLLNEEVK